MYFCQRRSCVCKLLRSHFGASRSYRPRYLVAALSNPRRFMFVFMSRQKKVWYKHLPPDGVTGIFIVYILHLMYFFTSEMTDCTDFLRRLMLHRHVSGQDSTPVFRVANTLLLYNYLHSSLIQTRDTSLNRACSKDSLKTIQCKSV
jgi:hypothetical protein